MVATLPTAVDSFAAGVGFVVSSVAPVLDGPPGQDRCSAPGQKAYIVIATDSVGVMQPAHPPCLRPNQLSRLIAAVSGPELICSALQMKSLTSKTYR